MEALYWMPNGTIVRKLRAYRVGKTRLGLKREVLARVITPPVVVGGLVIQHRHFKISTDSLAPYFGSKRNWRER